MFTRVFDYRINVHEIGGVDQLALTEHWYGAQNSNTTPTSHFSCMRSLRGHHSRPEIACFQLVLADLYRVHAGLPKATSWGLADDGLIHQSGFM
jgi:hypothetical protein